jgi:hypothetical protein
VIESREDSDSIKRKISSKVSFWDHQTGVDKLFKVICLKNNSSLLIISINLCSNKNMIQLFNLNLHEVFNLFSRLHLRDLVFQDSIKIVSRLGNGIKLLK